MESSQDKFYEMWGSVDSQIIFFSYAKPKVYMDFILDMESMDFKPDKKGNPKRNVEYSALRVNYFESDSNNSYIIHGRNCKIRFPKATFRKAMMSAMANYGGVFFLRGKIIRLKIRYIKEKEYDIGYISIVDKEDGSENIIFDKIDDENQKNS